MTTPRRIPSKLPPILQTPGLRLIEMGRQGNKTYLKFGVDQGDVREITVVMTAPGPIDWTYEYAIYDALTSTVTLYRGKHGDRDKDRRVRIQGA